MRTSTIAAVSAGTVITGLLGKPLNCAILAVFHVDHMATGGLCADLLKFSDSSLCHLF